MSQNIIKSRCRICKAAVSQYAATCPLCGAARPVYESLELIEKEYLDNPPTIEGKFYYLLDTINGLKPLNYNFSRELPRYLTNISLSFPIYLSCAGAFISICAILFMKVFFLFPLIALGGFLGYITLDLVSFSKSLTSAHITKRLEAKGGASPYSVHFKVEEQFNQMLRSLSKILYAFLDHKPAYNTEEERYSCENVLSAIKALTSRIKKYAKISLEVSETIWRNNVYAIAAEYNPNSVEKERFINNKIREGEALILRHCWLNHLDSIEESIRTYLQNPNPVVEFITFKREVIEDNKLAPNGPLSEGMRNDYQSLPYELPFKMRYHMIEQLRPEPLPAENIIALFPETETFFQSIDQVRAMKSKIVHQEMLDKTNAALMGVENDNGLIQFDADDVRENAKPSSFLDFSSFAANSDDLQKQIDRLNAQLRL